MARKALIIKAKKTPKYPTREYHICLVCGRTRGLFRLYNDWICRIHLRQYVYQGLLPGWRKGS